MKGPLLGRQEPGLWKLKCMHFFGSVCVCVYIYIYIFFCFNVFLPLFLAVVGLHCCTRAFSSFGRRGLLFIAVHRLLTAVASLITEHRL